MFWSGLFRPHVAWRPREKLKRSCYRVLREINAKNAKQEQSGRYAGVIVAYIRPIVPHLYSPQLDQEEMHYYFVVKLTAPMM